MIVKITEAQAQDIRSSHEEPGVICARYPHLIPDEVVRLRALPKEKLHPSWSID